MCYPALQTRWMVVLELTRVSYPLLRSVEAVAQLHAVDPRRGVADQGIDDLRRPWVRNRQAARGVLADPVEDVVGIKNHVVAIGGVGPDPTQVDQGVGRRQVIWTIEDRVVGLIPPDVGAGQGQGARIEVQ